MIRAILDIVVYEHSETLYLNLEQCISEHLALLVRVIQEKPDETLLKNLSTEIWPQYSASTSRLRDLFMCLDRNYLVHNGGLFVYDLGVHLFRTMIMEKSTAGERVARLILEQIHSDRCGESVDKMIMKNITTMLHDIHFYESIQRKVILQSSAYYKQYAQQMMAQCTVSEYLSIVERSLEEEEERAENYLQQSTKPLLFDAVQEEMITNALDLILEHNTTGLYSMIDKNQTDDLKRMYRLLSLDESHRQRLIAR